MQQRSSDEQFDDFDQLDQEAKRQIILKRRRLFSQYRQYEQWRKKQFSYDSYHYRPLVNAAATKRRRLYRRQYSCVENSEGSRDSHDSKYYIPNEGCVGVAAASAADSSKENNASESNSVSVNLCHLFSAPFTSIVYIQIHTSTCT